MSQGMWKRAVLALTSAAWTLAVVDVIGWLPDGDSIARLALAVAIVTTGRLMLWSHQRPIGQAYELGYEEGHADARRDALREVNTRRQVVSPIRRTANGLSEFNRRHVSTRDRSKVDAW